MNAFSGLWSRPQVPNYPPQSHLHSLWQPCPGELLCEEKLSLAACLWSSLSYIEAIFVISFVESFATLSAFGNSWLHEAELSVSCQKWA